MARWTMDNSKNWVAEFPLFCILVLVLRNACNELSPYTLILIRQVM